MKRLSDEAGVDSLTQSYAHVVFLRSYASPMLTRVFYANAKGL
jgi:hypothetical protein